MTLYVFFEEVTALFSKNTEHLCAGNGVVYQEGAKPAVLLPLSASDPAGLLTEWRAYDTGSPAPPVSAKQSCLPCPEGGLRGALGATAKYTRRKW